MQAEGKDEVYPRSCDICGTAMRLVRLMPKAGPLPELRTFRCDACGHVRTEETEENQV